MKSRLRGEVLRQASPISRFGSGARKRNRRMSPPVCTSLAMAISERRGFREEDFAWIAELGFDFVRLPLDYRCWIEQGDWTRLRETFMSDTYYPADVAWDGHVLRNVGVRSRGFGSRDSRKPGLKVVS